MRIFPLIDLKILIFLGSEYSGIVDKLPIIYFHVSIYVKELKLSAFLFTTGSPCLLKNPETVFHALSRGPDSVLGASSETTLFLDFLLFLIPGFKACPSLMNLFSNSSEMV